MLRFVRGKKMKKSIAVLVILSLVILLGFGGCATGSAKYKSYADAHDFAYFFPHSSGEKSFDTYDEAYEYVRTAQAKFASSVGDKQMAKGMPGKLDGPEVKMTKPVRVLYFLFASGDQDVHLNLSGNIEETIVKASSTSVVFLMFFEGRGIALANYYLQKGYIYTSANQHTGFFVDRQNYNVEYPGWTNTKALSYLRGK